MAAILSRPLCVNICVINVSQLPRLIKDCRKCHSCTQYIRLFHCSSSHDDVIKWKHFPRYCPYVREIHRSSVNSPHKGQWREAFMFSLICVWINGRVNNREPGDLRRCGAHYDVILMLVIHRNTLMHFLKSCKTSILALWSLLLA